MRKEEEPEHPELAAAEAKPKTRGPRKPVVETEDENMGEDTLLGESTLAKLNVSRKTDDPAPADENAAAAAQ